MINSLSPFFYKYSEEMEGKYWITPVTNLDQAMDSMHFSSNNLLIMI